MQYIKNQISLVGLASASPCPFQSPPTHMKISIIKCHHGSLRHTPSVSERQRSKLNVKQFLCVQEQIKSKYNYDIKVASSFVKEISLFLPIADEALQITYSYWDGAGHRRVMQVRKGDTIGEFLRAVQQQLAPEFREIRTTSVENLLSTQFL